MLKEIFLEEEDIDRLYDMSMGTAFVGVLCYLFELRGEYT